MCRSRLPALRSLSSTSFEIACTCRLLAPEHMTKYSVKEAIWRRSRIAMSVAFLSLAARAARRAASSISIISGCSSLFALRLINSPPVHSVPRNIVGHERGDQSFYVSALSRPLPDLRRRDVLDHVIGQVYLSARSRGLRRFPSAPS